MVAVLFGESMVCSSDLLALSRSTNPDVAGSDKLSSTAATPSERPAAHLPESLAPHDTILCELPVLPHSPTAARAAIAAAAAAEGVE